VVKRRLQVGESQKIILVSSGSLGTGIDRGLIQKIAHLPNVKVAVVCGKNTEAFERLSRELASPNILVLGFYTPMDELYAVADIFISKPGGLSTAEALRWNLPLIVSHMLPGQEALNIEYLSEKKLVMPRSIDLAHDVSKELESQNFKKSLIYNQAVKEILKPRDVLLEAVKSAS
jgi:UDP-N-acetylglucosamine:LPS N-acetylglucosamine transferase